VKVYLAAGPSGTYKTVKFTSETSGEDVLKYMAEKLNLSQYYAYLELMEIKKDAQRKVGRDENVYKLKVKWPLVFGQTGNETHLHYHFIVRLRSDPQLPPEAAKIYNAAI